MHSLFFRNARDRKCAVAVCIRLHHQMNANARTYQRSNETNVGSECIEIDVHPGTERLHVASSSTRSPRHIRPDARACENTPRVLKDEGRSRTLPSFARLPQKEKSCRSKPFAVCSR